MIIKRDNGLAELFADDRETKLCGGFAFTEGPVWVSPDNCLLFSDIPNNRIHRWRPGNSDAEIYREPSGNANGLTLDHDGNVLACEHSGRRVSRAPYNGAADAVVEEYEGLRLNNPNDLVVHSSGAIYFTNPWLSDGLQKLMGAPGAVKEMRDRVSTVSLQMARSAVSMTVSPSPTVSHFPRMNRFSTSMTRAPARFVRSTRRPMVRSLKAICW